MSVYFAQVGPVVKIGYSGNPERRVANLFRGTTLYGAPAVALEHRGERRLIRSIPGSKSTERAIQLALSDFNVGLEWFAAEAPLLAFVDTVEPSVTYARVPRPGGRIRWEPSQMAGGNYELVMAAHLGRVSAPTDPQKGRRSGRGVRVCATESRPAAGADLTSSLTTRPTERRAVSVVAHAATDGAP